MKMFFCTLFNSNYAAKGLAMYHSLLRSCPDFQLYIFAFDDSLVEVLNDMALLNVRVIPLVEFEDSELLRIKGSRTPGEYCWTCTSSTILYCLSHFDIPHCTYIDADLFFLSNPACLIDEMGDDDVLITEHRYTPQYDQSLNSGIYCVQFVTFKNTENGLHILNWWRERCIEWCYNKQEDGKFGDQKYLDDWLTRFQGVHSLQHIGGGVAPWNMQQYEYRICAESKKVQVRVHNSGKWTSVVFFHFHALLSYNKKGVREFYAQEYQMPDGARKYLYTPYVRALKKAFFEIRRMDRTVDGVATQPQPIIGWWNYAKKIRRRIINKENRYFYWFAR